MATTTVTLTGDISDAIGTDFETNDTKVLLRYNTDKVVTDSGPIRLGAGVTTLNPDGTFSIANVVAETSLVENLQTTVVVTYRNQATRTRQEAVFGPYDLTGLGGTVSIRNLEVVQALDATVLSQYMAQLQQYVDDAARIVGLADSDDAFAALINGVGGVGPLSRAALASAIIQQTINPADVGGDGIGVVGQSNAQGYGRSFDQFLDPADSRIFQVPGSGPYKGREIPAVEPLIHYSQLPASIGHALAFARLLIRTTPIHRRLVLIPAAMGSTGFQDNTSGGGGTWNQTIDLPVSGLNLAREFVARTNAWIASDPNNRLRVIVWHQGEADATAGRSSADYAAKWDSMVAYFRANIIGAADVPVIVGEMVPEDAARDGKPAIQLAHVATPGRVLRTAFTLGPRGYQQFTGSTPEQHYTADGQRVLGARTFESYRRALVNVEGTAPVPPPAVVLVQAGTSVTATWGQPMGRTTAYQVQKKINNGSWTDVTHNTLDVTEILTGVAAGTLVTFRVRSVNTVGTSEWATSSTLTTVDVPGQVTGLTAGTASSSAQQLTWNPVPTATSYLVEYKKHSDATYLPGPTVTGTAGTVTGLTATTSYDYRVTAINAAGSGTPSAVATSPTADLQPVIADSSVTAFRAIGLRKLRSGVTNAIRVRRASDNAETDIGFVGMQLDTAAVQTFGGAGDVFVKTFYDQSGNGRHRTQTDTTKQAQILIAGALLLKQGRPYARLRGIYTDGTVGLYAAGAATVGVVLESMGDTTPALATLASESTSTAGGTVYALLNITAAWRNQMLLRNAEAITVLNSGGAGALLTGGPHSVVNTDAGTSVTLSMDGVAAALATYTRSGTVVPTASNFGGYLNAVEPGDVAEVVEWASALSDSQRAAVHANQKSYYSTP